MWEIATGQCVGILEGHTGPVTSVCLSPDDQRALSGSEDRTVRAWHLPTARHLWTFTGHKEGVTSLSTDGRSVLTGSLDGTMKLLKLASGWCVATFEGQREPVRSVCLSMDGRFATSARSSGRWELWDVRSGRYLRSFESHDAAFCSVCLAADASYAVAGCADGTLKLWYLDWELEALDPVAWDPGIQPYLIDFLTRHTPYVARMPEKTIGDEISLGLTRRGRATWTDADFRQLLNILGCAGYGWLRPEGVRQELEKMAANWQGPPPLS